MVIGSGFGLQEKRVDGIRRTFVACLVVVVVVVVVVVPYFPLR